MDNADVVAYTTVAGDFTGVLHLSIDSSSGDAVYNAPEAATTAITICPKYLEECLVPDPLTFSVADDDLTACSNGNATWRMGKLTTNRISSTIDSTTYYIIGQAPKLTQDTNGLETSGTVIVEAHDLF
jgi:hypothetical protein